MTEFRKPQGVSPSSLFIYNEQGELREHPIAKRSLSSIIFVSVAIWAFTGLWVRMVIILANRYADDDCTITNERIIRNLIFTVVLTALMFYFIWLIGAKDLFVVMA